MCIIALTDNDSVNKSKWLVEELIRKGILFMSTKKEMLGKENRKEKGHRRYSLLLLALLFIGFASYGTYAYFSNSTETSKAHLTLNGLSGDYTPGGTDKDGKHFEGKTGDGTTNTSDTSNNTEYTPDNSGNGGGTFTPVKDDTTTTGQDESKNSTQFGEFDWVYVGNDKELNNNAGVSTSSNLLTASFGLDHLNTYITSSERNTVFGNVVEGDVFRKTIRLAVNGDSKIPATAKLVWNGVAGEDIEGIKAAAYVRVADQTTDGKAQAFDANAFTESKSVVLGTGETTLAIGQVKTKQYIDVELVAAVKNGVDTTDAQLAKIARQLTIHLDQETNNVIK